MNKRLQINWTQGNSTDCLRASHPLLGNVHLDGLYIYKKPSTGFYHCAIYEVEQQFASSRHRGGFRDFPYRVLC